MRRVMVIGNAAGGKSTLSLKLARDHNLPYHALDHIMWQPGWVRVSDEVFDTAHGKLIMQDRWLIDGYGPWGAVLTRMDQADTIVLIDLPFTRHLLWAAKRQIKSLFKEPVGTPEGCALFPMTLRIFRMMWWLHRVMRPKLLNELDQRRHQARIVHLTTKQALADFTLTPT